MKDNSMFIGLRDPKEPIDASYDNVIMTRLADAYRGTMLEQHIGDSIDRGLVLLRELNAQGFDVIIKTTEQEGECNECKGTGLGRSTLDCPMCDGTGRAATEQED